MMSDLVERGKAFRAALNVWPGNTAAAQSKLVGELVAEIERLRECQHTVMVETMERDTKLRQRIAKLEKVLEAAEQHTHYADNGCKHISDHSWHSYQILKEALAAAQEQDDG